MTNVLGILQQLENFANLFYQLIIVFTLYQLASYSFLGKLKEVLLHREENTSKLLEKAKLKLTQAAQMEEVSKEELKKKQHEIDDKFRKIKEELALEQETQTKTLTEQSLEKYNKSKAELEAQMLELQKGVWAKKEELANQLLKKLSNSEQNNRQENS